MELIAASTAFSIIGFAITAPTLLVLFASAYLFAKTRVQRMVNLCCGFLLATASIFVVVVFFSPAPNSWADKNFAWIVAGIAPIGSAFGVALANGYRLAISRRAT